jgi:hypothetical protein
MEIAENPKKSRQHNFYFMEKKEIYEIVVGILRDAGVHGKINPGTKLSVYVPSPLKQAFAARVASIFNKLDLRDLTNDLSDSISTVDDLITYIYEKYQPKKQV